MTLSDKNQFNTILDKYADMVYSIAMTHLIDKSIADDISQEVFLRLVSHFISFNDDDHMKHWLIRTTINRCISSNRKHLRRNHIRNEMNVYAPDDTLSADMRMLIAELPKKYREAVLLCICDDLTADEAAAILHRNPNTLRSQVQRAKKILREKLEGAI